MDELQEIIRKQSLKIDALEYFFKCFNDLTLKSTDNFIEHLERLENRGGEMFAEYKQEIIKIWESQNTPYKWSEE